jgi:hypothetical protein
METTKPPHYSTPKPIESSLAHKSELITGYRSYFQKIEHANTKCGDGDSNRFLTNLLKNI